MPLSNYTVVRLLCLFAALFLACSKKKDVSEEAQPSAPLAAPTAPGAASAAASESTPVDLAALTQAVRKYGVEKQRVPSNLDEVVAAGYLPSVPVAPSGKKFAIDQQMQVYLADN